MSTVGRLRPTVPSARRTTPGPATGWRGRRELWHRKLGGGHPRRVLYGFSWERVPWDLYARDEKRDTTPLPLPLQTPAHEKYSPVQQVRNQCRWIPRQTPDVHEFRLGKKSRLPGRVCKTRHLNTTPFVLFKNTLTKMSFLLLPLFPDPTQVTGSAALIFLHTICPYIHYRLPVYIACSHISPYIRAWI